MRKLNSAGIQPAMRLAISVAVSATMGLASLALANPAMAAPPGNARCEETGVNYGVFNKQDIHIPTGIDFKNGPGGTVSASVQHGLQVKFGMKADFTVGGSVIVAKAEGTFGINAEVSSTFATTYSYSRTIPNNKYGHIQFGNWGWRMGVDKTIVDNNCKITKREVGTVTAMPSLSSWGYKYWETSR